MSYSEGNRLPVTSPYNIMNEKVPSGVTFPSIVSSDFSHIGAERLFDTAKCQIYHPQKQKIMVNMSGTV